MTKASGIQFSFVQLLMWTACFLGLWVANGVAHREIERGYLDVMSRLERAYIRALLFSLIMIIYTLGTSAGVALDLLIRRIMGLFGRKASSSGRALRWHLLFWGRCGLLISYLVIGLFDLLAPSLEGGGQEFSNRIMGTAMAVCFALILILDLLRRPVRTENSSQPERRPE